MRVAFFVNWFPVLSEPFVVNALLGLVQDGAEVDVYALEGPAGERRAFPALDEQERWRAMAAPASLSGRLRSAPADLARVIGAYGFGALGLLDVFGYRKRALNLRALSEAALFEHGGRYDVIHCHFGTLADAVLKHRKAGFLKGPVVVHFRGYDISQVVDAYGPKVYRRAFAEADWFLANCGFFRDRAVAIGCPPDRIDVVPSGVDVERFAFAPPQVPADAGLRLLSVGRLVEKKGFAYALEAAARLRAAGVDLTYRIVGDGPLRSALQARASELGVGDVVTFVGGQPHAKVLEELRWAHLFLAPSITADDGAQDAPVNTLKEAMAAGVPVVSTWHGGIPELVIDRKTGRLAPERDAAALADALLDLARDPTACADLARAGRELVVAEHARQVSDRKLRRAYASAIARAQSSNSGRTSWTVNSTPEPARPLS